MPPASQELSDDQVSPVPPAGGSRRDTALNTAGPAIEVVTGDGGPGPYARAWADIRDGFEDWRLWLMLGWQDIRQRYRRTLIGPFWLTISLGFLVGMLGTLYGVLFGRPLEIYIPHVALGFIAWQFIASSVTDGCNGFIGSESFLKQVQVPFTSHIYRTVWRNLIIMAHNFVVYLVVAAVFGIWAGFASLLIIPGLVLTAATAAWVGLLFGLVCARFRDVPNIVASVIRIGFFLTPIIWIPDMVPKRAILVELNPFYHYVEVIRAPLLGTVPSLKTWLVVVALTVVGWAITYLFFARYRQRIPYWL